MTETGSRNTGIDDALNLAREAYATAAPRSLARYVEATTVMPGGNTRTGQHHAPFPLAMARAKGCHVWDLDGREYIDCLGDSDAGLYGHAHPAIRIAIDGALDDGIASGAASAAEVQFASTVCERFGLQRVRFGNSGTEANAMAVSLGRIFTRRTNVLTFRGGWTDPVSGFGGALSRADGPSGYAVADYNDIEGTRALIAGDLALVIVEPMFGGGCIPASTAFLAMLRQETTRVGALLVFDERATSRLAFGGLQSVVGVKPDLTTLGTYLGGGLPLGAFGGRADIMDLLDPRRTDAVSLADPSGPAEPSMAAGHAGLTRVYTRKAVETLNTRGETLRARLNGLCRAADAPLCFTGTGSMLAAHTVRAPVETPEDAAKADPRLQELFFFDMLARGVLLDRRGTMALSLPAGDAGCDALAAAVESFLTLRRSLLLSTRMPEAHRARALD